MNYNWGMLSKKWNVRCNWQKTKELVTGIICRILLGLCVLFECTRCRKPITYILVKYCLEYGDCCINILFHATCFLQGNWNHLVIDGWFYLIILLWFSETFQFILKQLQKFQKYNRNKWTTMTFLITTA